MPNKRSVFPDGIVHVSEEAPTTRQTDSLGTHDVEVSILSPKNERSPSHVAGLKHLISRHETVQALTSNRYRQIFYLWLSDHLVSDSSISDRLQSESLVCGH